MGAQLLLLAALGAPSTATLDQSRTLFQEGQTAYKTGAFRQAITAFLKADQLNPSPTLTYDVAQCFERLGELPKAVEYYEAYLSKLPNAPDADAVAATIANLRAQIAKSNAVVVLAPEAAPAASPDALVLEGARPAHDKAFHPSPTAIAFGVGGLVAAGFAVAGAVDVAQFQSTLSEVKKSPATVSYSNASAQAGAAMGWGIAALVLSIAAVGGVTGAVLTW
jgi:tetratricopeptide (TPR) repeat protein